ncbi:AraC family transcriptional regulator [Janthinobacterium fluminis]|uniref:Helix-turn-helix transcriptional regulator n=1 Tax=Janthinobacterium fluminis TaxID=2987524 RepID=A0ABT5K3I7_9BURK|nr:helix-turn-helix transcriptional regulator [Janthinobacterium fluminis]MDC8759025.1 helix-turn-helix transcriptional regulator [Janthinobacterium fluminis]
MPESISSAAVPDLSEQADGPPLIALLSEPGPDSQFLLGTREYGWHSHLRGQMFCIESGLMHVRTSHGSWLLPPHRAGWIPPDMTHKVSVIGALSGWSILIAPQASASLPQRPCVTAVNELMGALVRRAASWTTRDPLDQGQERVMGVLLDEMRRAPQQALHLPMPSERRLVRVAHAILARPGERRNLDEWAGWGGMSARTLSRLFRAETGCSFAQWRQQAGLVYALERLALGESVATVADALGYATPSNFIAMFRRAFGESPGRYFGAAKQTGR